MEYKIGKEIENILNTVNDVVGYEYDDIPIDKIMQTRMYEVLRKVRLQLNDLIRNNK